METIGDRVRAERETRKWSRRILAEKTGLSQTAISDLELGYSKKSLSLHRLASALGVRPEYLETGKGPKAPSGAIDEWSDVVAYAQHAAAGDGSAPDEYAETDRLKFKAASLRKKGLHARKLAIFTARGDSMEPRILDGDALLFDQDDTAPRDGTIFVVNYEGDYLVKRLAQYGSQWFLTSDNAADPRWKKPRPIVIGDTCEIIGRVRWIGSWED